jgi:HlyD family secretion protein
MKNKKRLIILVPAILLVAVLAYFILGRSADRRVIRVSGNIEVTDAEVSFKIPGRVEARLVDEGETVKAGQTVARLDSVELTQEVAVRRAEVQAVQAVLAELEAGSRLEEIAQAEASAGQAKARLDEMLAGSRPEELSAAEAVRRRAKTWAGARPPPASQRSAGRGGDAPGLCHAGLAALGGRSFQERGAG